MLKYELLVTGHAAYERFLHPMLRTSVLLLCTLNLVIAQSTKGNLSGRVLSSDNSAIEAAVIQFAGNTTISDEKGQFSFNNIPPGNYVLDVKMMGFSKASQSVTLEPGKVKVVNVQLVHGAKDLEEVVVTGQFEPQSLRNSIYQVRTIDSERIRLRGATNVQTVLNTELGMRFANDLTLGTSDIQLMGMTGQSVKILLDGVPMVDRGSTRESLGQIDINNIERIEIVEGPMSVIYGTDALAGVINIITKKSAGGENLSVFARVQEETTGDEYTALSKKGVHNQNIGLTWRKSRMELSGSVSNNNFGGWQGAGTGRAKSWMPKDQLLYNAALKYGGDKWNAWYSFNGTDEVIHYLGNPNARNVAGDKDYITYRWFHQLQGEYRKSDKLNFAGALSYTDYSRRTLSTDIDLNTNKRTLSLDAAAQDKSIFTTTFFRGTTLYKLSSSLLLKAGIDISNNNSSGQRILGSPTINEYALFVSPEWGVTSAIKINPGLRFLKNSVYDAPPVIPSINGKIKLNEEFDLRFGYARGFRSPALRELYFNFHDASHSINGNVNLKAEYSNSFNAFLVWRSLDRSGIRVSSTLGSFYNVFHDLIDTGVDPNNAGQTTYININLFKTTGFTLENKLNTKNIQVTLGGSYIARYNQYSESQAELGESPEFTWSPEINTTVLYSFPKIGASISLFYKYTGKRPVYELNSTLTEVNLSETAAFNMADLTFNKAVTRYINFIGGVKNIFDVTNLRNTSQDTSGAHSTGGPVPLSYGRSYFLGVSVNWSKH